MNSFTTVPTEAKRFKSAAAKSASTSTPSVGPLLNRLMAADADLRRLVGCVNPVSRGQLSKEAQS